MCNIYIIYYLYNQKIIDMSHKKGKIRIVASLEGHDGPVESVVFHPTAHLMATAGGDNVVKLWDTDSHQCLATLVGHTEPVLCVAFHPTAPVLISGSADNTLKVWDTTTHQCLSTTPLPVNRSVFKGVSCIAIHPIMSFIVTGENGMEPPKLWKLSDDNTKLDFVCNIKSMDLGNASTRCVAVHPTEPLFATGRARTREDSSSLLWSYEKTKQGVKTNLEKEIENGRENHSKNVVSIALHPTKPFIATGSNDNSIMLWKLDFNKNGKIGRSVCMAILVDHDAAVTGLAFHPTAPVLVSCSADTSVIGWGFSDDLMTVDIIGRLFGNRGPVTSIAFHSNGRLLATGNQDNAALLWDCSVLSSKKQRSMALMRGLEQSLVPKFFSRHMTPWQFARSDAARFMRNTLKKRGPNFLRNLEQPARAAAIAALMSRRAMATARAPMRAMAMIEGPKPRSGSSSPKSPKSHSRTPSPKSPKSHSRTPSPKSPKENKSGGGTSITRHRRNNSSRKIKRHSSKTQRYRRFIKM
jgi:WD40 repeat protein